MRELRSMEMKEFAHCHTVSAPELEARLPDSFHFLSFRKEAWVAVVGPARRWFWLTVVSGTVARQSR